MAVKDGSPGDDKLKLAFGDGNDESSRMANRRVKKLSGPSAAPARPVGTDPGRQRDNLGIQAGAAMICREDGRGAPWGFDEDWSNRNGSSQGNWTRQAKGNKVIGRLDGLKRNKPKPSSADETDSRHLEEAASPGPLGPEPKGGHSDALRKNNDNVDMDSHKNADDNTNKEDTSAMAREYR